MLFCFDLFDRDSKGLLTKSQFIRACRSLDFKESDSKLARIFLQQNLSNGNLMDFTEFKKITKNL